MKYKTYKFNSSAQKKCASLILATGQPWQVALHHSFLYVVIRFENGHVIYAK